MTSIIVLLVLDISLCFGYTYNADNSKRWCDVEWYFLSEDSFSNSVILNNISDSSLMDCYMSCEVMEVCGGAAFRAPNQCLLINETAVPLNAVNKTKSRNATTDLMITEVNRLDGQKGIT